MKSQEHRALFAVLRRILFTGLILLGAWQFLFALRSRIPVDVIRLMNSQVSGIKAGQIPLDSSTWDWSRSLWTNEPVSNLISQRLPITLRLIGLGTLASLVIAAILLFIGVGIIRMTRQPDWLAGLRSILRSLLVSTNVSVPVFVVGTYYVVSMAVRYGINGMQTWNSPQMIIPSVFLVSTIPAWLLVQAGQGEIANWGETLDGKALARLGVNLLARSLRLVGVIIVIGFIVEQVMAQPGLGRAFIDSLNQRDFPLMFGVAWILVVIVAIAKLAGDIVEITGNALIEQGATIEPVTEESNTRRRIPSGWILFTMAFAGLFVILAVFGPNLAPHGYNEINLQYRLAPPGQGSLLGYDNLGRDILSRLLYGLRLDVTAGIAVAGILVVLAAGWALLADFLRRMNSVTGDFLEDLVMLPLQTIGVFPWLALLLLLISILGTPGLVPFLFAGSVVLLPRAVNMIRESSRSLPEEKGIFMGLLKAMPVMLVFTVGGTVLYLSTASFLGMGILPPYPEIGGQLSGAGRQYMMVAPWMMYWPATVLTLLIASWVMAGDSLLEWLGFRTKAVWSKVME